MLKLVSLVNCATSTTRWGVTSTPCAATTARSKSSPASECRRRDGLRLSARARTGDGTAQWLAVTESQLPSVCFYMRPVAHVVRVRRLSSAVPLTSGVGSCDGC